MVDHHARIRAFGPELDATRARGEAFTLPPPQSVDVGIEDVAGTRDASGVDALQATLSLAGTYELGDKRAPRSTRLAPNSGSFGSASPRSRPATTPISSRPKRVAKSPAMRRRS